MGKFGGKKKTLGVVKRRQAIVDPFCGLKYSNLMTS
jgi:hypothetical protein